MYGVLRLRKTRATQTANEKIVYKTGAASDHGVKIGLLA